MIAGVQRNEDFAPPALAFYYADGVTPLSLVGVTFSAYVGTNEVSTTVSGAGNNVLSLFAPNADMAGWFPGTYPLTLLATDGTEFHSLFAFSTVTVGAPVLDSVIMLGISGGVSTIVSPTSPVLAELLTETEPAAMATALAGLSSAQLSALAQAIAAAYPRQTGTSAPVPTGETFVTIDGFLGVAQ